MNTDERRARAIGVALIQEFADGQVVNWGDVLRAIRESDEAAGMVLVPKPPPDNAIWPADIVLDLHHTSMNAAMGRKFYRAMIAAHEG